MTHDTCHMSFSFACFFLDISNVQLTLILHDEALSLPVSDKLLTMLQIQNSNLN